MKYPYTLVDVFHDGPFTGNPVAVVGLDEDIETQQMQLITQWFNLSETTFLLPPIDPIADYRTRIFTLERELPFAGHPTLGTCHAWLERQEEDVTKDQFIQQCGVGLVPIRRGGERLAFEAPPLIKGGPVASNKIAEVCDVLRIDPSSVVECRWADNGPGWIGVMLKSAEAVLAVEPRRSHGNRIDIGLVGPYPADSDVAYEIRTIFSDQHGGLVEDPITGSFNASVAQWLYETNRVTTGYLAAQGTCIGRRGRIKVDFEKDGAAWVGGCTASLVRGTIEF